ncbi:MAG: tetratricopeptide repeat protein, partial [Propionibacteriaceae bacterium]
LMQIGDGVKLIDLGGVRSIGDEESTLYGTVGYQASEVASQGPSIASDLYTIGRTLLVLCSEFRGYQSTYQFTIPAPAELPLLGQYDSLYRLLLKCCAPDPHDRFTSTEELGVQLLGVLREVVASKVSGIAATSNQSQLFQPPTIGGDLFDWTQLPELKLNSTDPQYGWLTSLDIDDPRERLRALDNAPERTVEVNIARAQCALRTGDTELLATIQADVLSADPWEWRAVWLQGLAALSHHDVATAQSSFNAVYGQIPGELAPKLALAVACELGSELDVAETLYAICASTDANFVTPAGFGLARIRAKRGDLSAAMAALDMIPVTSRGYNEARRLKVQHLVDMGVGLADLSTAKTVVDDSRISPEQQSRYSVTIFERALDLVRHHGDMPSLQIGDVRASEATLRSRLSQEYRTLARLVTDPAERVSLIDKANQTKKWSIV